MGKNNKVYVPEPKPIKEKVKLSFEFYDTSCIDYCISEWEKTEILKALGRLKDINNKTYSDLTQGSKTYHFHQVSWEETTKKQGFPDPRVNSLDPYQIALVGINGGKARVFGAYANNIFYIVWFDYNHKIWPSYKKHT